MEWCKQVRYDPIKPLIESNNEAITYFTRRDLLQETVGPITALWSLKTPQTILKRQMSSGCWEYPAKGKDYYLLETFKKLQSLAYQYEFDCSHRAIARACEYLFSYQTDEGDIRGFIGNQYAPYYTGIVAALLIKAGYEDDPRIEKALNWLLSMRQSDGGWVIGSPGLIGLDWEDVKRLTSDKNADTIKAFDKSRPFSHSGTGMVIRAFAAHRRYRKSPEILTAAQLLKSHFFREDNYTSYKHSDHWVRFAFPFWWNNLLAALDSLSLIGIPAADTDIKRALDWLLSNQQTDGLWKASYSRIHKAPVNKKADELKLWITLSVCRVLKRFYS